MWKCVTDLDEKKQALAVALSQKGRARDVADDLVKDDQVDSGTPQSFYERGKGSILMKRTLSLIGYCGETTSRWGTILQTLNRNTTDP